MAKTIYEGYRIGKDGGERWSGILRSTPPASTKDKPAAAKKSGRPNYGSAFSHPPKPAKDS